MRKICGFLSLAFLFAGCQQNAANFQMQTNSQLFSLSSDSQISTQQKYTQENSTFVTNAFLDKIIAKIPKNYVRFETVGEDVYVTPQNIDDDRPRWKAVGFKPCESKLDPIIDPKCYTKLTLWNEGKYEGTFEDYLKQTYPFSEFLKKNGMFFGTQLVRKSGGGNYVASGTHYSFGTGADSPTLKDYAFFLNDKTIVRAAVSYYNWENGNSTYALPSEVAKVVDKFDAILREGF